MLHSPVIRSGALALVLLSGMAAAEAGNGDAVLTADTVSLRGTQTVCQRTANIMLKACKLDAREEIAKTNSHCMNIADASDRHDCQDEARDTLVEENEICLDQHDARDEACDLLGENRYDPDPIVDPSIEFIDPDEVPSVWPANPYVSIAAGHTFVLRATDGDEEEIVIVHVTDDVRVIQGVSCRVVSDVVLIEGEAKGGAVEYELIEVTDDWFAQDVNNNVYYCGEIARNYEDGVLRDLDGSFESGIDLAKGGLLIAGAPVPGMAHRTEYALGEAEDIVEYLSTGAAPGPGENGDNPKFPCSPGLCLKTHDTAPLEPEAGEYKYYLPGVGFVLAVDLEDGVVTGGREELVCVGDSLSVLKTPECEIADFAELIDELCDAAPDAFCD